MMMITVMLVEAISAISKSRPFSNGHRPIVYICGSRHLLPSCITGKSRAASNFDEIIGLDELLRLMILVHSNCFLYFFYSSYEMQLSQRDE